MRNAREESMKSGIYLGKREIEIKEMPLPKVGEIENKCLHIARRPLKIRLEYSNWGLCLC